MQSRQQMMEAAAKKKKGKVLVREQVTVLPNPFDIRLPVVQECIDIGCCKMLDGVCAVYPNPKAIQHRLGRQDACGINTKFAEDKTKKVRVGQGKTKSGGNK